MIIMLLYQIVVYTIVKKMRMSCKTNKFEITVPTWNKELHLPGGGHILYQIVKIISSIS